ncbi:MAG: 2OG-Fe(II) oxygenase [Myxococcaceae bacterium]|nr:2OG-Fe(II) oxygenase [Myxococcaceae bacterium]MCA3013854.1 2OG-Fe(II) oxygenase [Myxococcaceae bacterium]
MMAARRTLVVDGFAPMAAALRAHFDARFADPTDTRDDRFVWDLWNVPGQYTALRTPAYLYFPRRLYDAFHQRLVWWGRRVLGCHDVSPPWMSCYVNGCEQRLHGDLPHGQWAFVFSLTDWRRRTFRGGETLLLRDDVLDFWSGFRSQRAQEEPQLVEAIAPRFNRLTVFDPRLPHGVRRIDGSMDPREGRLVIHGWFVQPRPFIEGPLAPRRLSEGIEQVSRAMAPALEAGLPVAGLLSLGFRVGAGGLVGPVRVLSDTTRAPAHEEPRRRALVRLIRRSVQRLRFPATAAGSRVTLPLVFEQG